MMTLGGVPMNTLINLNLGSNKPDFFRIYSAKDLSESQISFESNGQGRVIMTVAQVQAGGPILTLKSVTRKTNAIEGTAIGVSLLLATLAYVGVGVWGLVDFQHSPRMVSLLFLGTLD